jgi:hypothetical protein
MLEVGDVVFTKAKGITVDEMAGDKAAFRMLRNFRAGIEATISFLKWTPRRQVVTAVRWLDSLRVEVTTIVQRICLGVGRDR